MSIGHPDPATPGIIADIGGTNARFAIVEPGDDQPNRARSLRCADYPDLVSAVEDYLHQVDAPRPERGLFAVACPVNGDALTLTNNHWRISIADTERRLELSQLEFINDFAAQALAIPHLREDELHRFGGGTPVGGRPIAVLGPGTGLGVAGLLPHGADWVPVQGEGGHVTFSPVTEREMAIAAAMTRRWGHCSAERVISGMGLVNLFSTIAGLDQRDVGVSNAEGVSSRALKGCPVANEAVTLFVRGLATTAANVAVTLGAQGGVYLCGGIIPKLGSLFDGATFRERFEHKGRFSDYMAAIPSYIVHAENPALRGLAKALRD